mmetsp:Transcript_41474/g.39901  ORF Transcript_41474/g.39901 Transcript_41474/m.39901 type:complete len:84 (-) Transcript_41474:420-671(-)
MEQYTDEKDWQTRELLECTMPVKLPSINVHLATVKKYQEAMGNETILKEVMSAHPKEADSIKELFQGIWSLEDLDKPEIKEII